MKSGWALAAAAFSFLASLLLAADARATIDVNITSIDPADGMLDDVTETTLVVSWEIEVDSGETGEYRVEVNGDGTPESGRLIESDDGIGDFNGNKTGQSTVRVADDLKEGDGDYTIYVIATDETDAENTASDSVTVTLDNVPDKPTGLRVGTGDQKLFLSWDTHPDRDIDHFLLYYATSPGTDPEDYNGTGADEGDSPIDVGTDTELVVKGLDNETTYYFRLQAVDNGGKASELSDEESGTPAKVSGLADLTGEEGGCFVATAAFGDSAALEVRVLRALRDQVLLRSAAGTAFVHWYYRASPPLAAWIAAHPAARTAARVALAPAVAASAVLLAVPAAWRGAILLVVLAGAASLVAWRLGLFPRLSRRGRLFFAAGLILAGLVGHPAERALAEQSPIYCSTDLHVGFLFLDEDRFEDVYDQNWLPTYGLAFGFKMVRDLELAASVSYGLKDGKGITATGAATDEKYQIHLVPATLGLLYRLRFVAEQPVVPYLGGGGSGAYFHESRVEQRDVKTDGAKWGWNAFGGVQFLLDLLDARSSAHMDLDYGINNTYLFYEFRYQVLGNMDADKKGLDLTSMVHTAGLLFEF